MSGSYTIHPPATTKRASFYGRSDSLPRNLLDDRQESIASFEQMQSLVRDTTTIEAEIKGNQAVFLVAGSGSAQATTRGVNGLIPARADDLTQNTATLAEWHN